MGMHEGRARLGKSMKELMMRWVETKAKWDDSSSKAFETRNLVPLEMDARQAVSAMDHMGQILSQIKRDCE
ncbi:MAG: hypothetical protein M3O30_02220 [Planctomycetota bacterium]|nr:hypothetical protein [Planctomycetota bacterium]